MSKKKAAAKNNNAKKPAVATVAEPAIASSAPKKDRTFLYQKIALFLIAFVIFANTIPNGFNIDDELYTTTAQKVSRFGLKSIPRIFSHNTFSDNENSFEYRPISMTTFVLQYITVGKSPHMSHLINVLIYAFTIVLLFTLLLKWFKKANPWYAFAVCALFAVHPLHTEIVDSIKSRDELLAFFFAIASFHVAWKFYTSKKWVYAIVFPLVFIFAIMCKKTVGPLAAIPFMAFFFFTDMPLKKIAITVVIMLAYLRLTSFSLSFILNTEQRLFFAMENPFYVSDFSFATKAATAIYVSGWYLLLHFVPFPLVFYYGYSYVPVVGWTEPLVWVSTLIYLGLTVYLIFSLRRKSIPGFGVAVFLLNIFIYSNLFRPAPGMMAERFAYAASLGFCIVAIWYLFKLFKVDPLNFNFSPAAKRLMIVLIIICTAYGARSFIRNRDWSDKITLYSRDIKYLHKSTKANMLNGELMMGLSKAYTRKAMALKNAGDMENAKISYDSSVYCLEVAKANFIQALDVTPNMGSAINNLAVIYFDEDSAAQAKKYIDMALNGGGNLAAGDVALNANDRAKLNHNLGVLLFKEKKTDSALLQFEKAIYYDPTFAQPYLDMSDVLLMSRDTVRAIKILQKAAQNLPEKGLAYTDLANISLYRNDTASALKYCEIAAKFRMVNPQIFVFLTNYYRAHNDLNKAQYYQQALQKFVKERKNSPIPEM